MNRIYTKTGDKGKTSLRTGKRVLKSDARVEVYGSVDELNSTIGLVIAVNNQSLIIDHLLSVQGDLFHVGALLAGEKKHRKKRINLLAERVKDLEKEIDKIQKELSEQTAFYLPGGSRAAAWLDFARSLARRVEREIVGSGEAAEEILVYINRLSDFLYVLARKMNKDEKVEEKEWKSEF